MSHPREIRTCVVLNHYCVVCYTRFLLSHGHFSPNSSRKIHLARPLERDMGVFFELEMWPKYYIRSCCAEYNMVLCCTAIYREYITCCIEPRYIESRLHLYFCNQRDLIIILWSSGSQGDTTERFRNYQTLVVKRRVNLVYMYVVSIISILW